jgi:hypothetical protein
MDEHAMDALVRAVTKGTASARRSSVGRKLIRVNDYYFHLAVAADKAGQQKARSACGRAIEAIDELFRLAKSGDKFAPWFLAILLDDSVLQLNRPDSIEIFESAARRMPHCPVLVSKNSAFGHNANKILDDLAVGVGLPYYVGEFKKLTTDVFGAYAIQLRCALEVNGVAKTLPKFSTRNIDAWWAEAKRVFIDKFGTATSEWPEEIREQIPKSRKSESSKREYVLRRLKQRLTSAARP